MKQRVFPLICLSSVLLFTGCGTVSHLSSDHHAVSSTSNSSQPSDSKSVPPHYPILVYNNPNYVSESQSLQIQGWWAGQVTEGRAYPTTKSQAMAHAPWKMDPVQVAQVATINFAPPKLMSKPWHVVKNIPNQEIQYALHGHTITYSIVSKKSATTSTPKTAVVQSSGLEHNLRISLFVPRDCYFWVIYKVELTG